MTFSIVIFQSVYIIFVLGFILLSCSVLLVNILKYRVLVYYYIRNLKTFLFKSKAVGFSFNIIALLEMFRLGQHGVIPNLRFNLQTLPEVLQHVNRRLELDSSCVYYLSKAYRGYDSGEINRHDIKLFKETQDLSLIRLNEFKVRTKNTINIPKIEDLYSAYSRPSINEINNPFKQGFRPRGVDSLEIGIVKEEQFKFLKDKYDLRNFDSPTIKFEDLSDWFHFYEKHPKHEGPSLNSVITELGFEKMEFFLETQLEDAMILQDIDKFIADNPTFPL